MNKIPFYTPCFVAEPILGVTHHLFGKSIFKETIFPFASYVYFAEKIALSVYKKLQFVIGSPSTHKELITNGFDENRTHLIYYGVDHQTFKLNEIEKSKSPLIGALGRLKKYKNFDHLLEAFVLVKKISQMQNW